MTFDFADIIDYTIFGCPQMTPPGRLAPSVRGRRRRGFCGDRAARGEHLPTLSLHRSGWMPCGGRVPGRHPRSGGRGTSGQEILWFQTLMILKVTHHGSNTSSTPLFLSRFPPKVAVIQCGADNPYGHPTPETLDRLQRVGAKIFRNDEDGDVIATIKDQELKVATTKR